MKILGIDLGATKLAALLVDDERRFQRTLVLPKGEGFSEDRQKIAEFITELTLPFKNKVITKCVCSIAATVNSEGVVVRWPNRDYWEGQNLKEFFETIIDTEVSFEDDGNAAAYAEAAGQGIDNLFYFGIGSGIGGGIVLNKRLLKVDGDQAAEFGHICVFPEGAACSCGRKGCLQAYASGRAILQNAYGDEWVNKSKSDLLIGLGKNEKSVVEAVNLGAEMLARVLLNLNEIINIKKCVIGGGLGNEFFELYSRVDFFMRRLMRKGQSEINIFSAIYGNASSLEGAVLLAQG